MTIYCHVGIELSIAARALGPIDGADDVLYGAPVLPSQVKPRK
jgi:hypothetical protein